jgi:hypothetical protein
MTIQNSKTTKGAVKIAKEDASSWTSRNLYAVDNVNVAQGPRVGVNGAKGKRASFQEAKEAREPLATIINDAYAKRAHEYAEFEYTNGGSIHDNTYEKTKKHGVKLGKSNKSSRGA